MLLMCIYTYISVRVSKDCPCVKDCEVFTALTQLSKLVPLGFFANRFKVTTRRMPDKDRSLTWMERFWPQVVGEFLFTVTSTHKKTNAGATARFLFKNSMGFVSLTGPLPHYTLFLTLWVSFSEWARFVRKGCVQNEEGPRVVCEDPGDWELGSRGASGWGV